jgi:hypothetical protein
MNSRRVGAVYITAWLNQEDGVANRPQSLKTATSIILIAATAVMLLCASLLGAELYMWHSAESMLTAMVQCIVDDDASVSIMATPPLLLQALTGRYTDITIATAGRQVRTAKGMTVVVDIKDIRLRKGGSSGGTIGSLNAVIAWTDEGMTRTAQQAIPLFGGFVTAVTSDPSAGTIALQGLLGAVTAKPTVADGGLRLQVKSLTELGWPLPREGLQSAVDASFATQMKRDLPEGLRVDDVRVTDTGVAAHLSARNTSIPATTQGSCAPGNHE